MHGECKCGTTHGRERWGDDIECVYDYRDERGVLLFQTVRKISKKFVYRRPNGDGTWEWNISGVRRPLYRLPELLRAPLAETVFVVEGEKDVDRLRSLGAVATCNPMGARSWSVVDECAQKALRGRDLVIITDDDDDGRYFTTSVAQWALSVAAKIRKLELYRPGDTKRDVSDWFDEGHTLDELRDIASRVETVETGVKADPWTDELAAALADVKGKLDAATVGTRAPLFGDDAADLICETFPPAQWQVTGLVARGGTTVTAGEPKAAIKTWLLLEAAIAIATGTKMCGEFFAERGRVAFFFAEDQRQSIRNRVRALLAGAGRSLERGRLHLQGRGQFIDVLRDDDLAWVVASVRRFGKIDLLVLDPLRDIHSGEEDKSDAMRDVMRRLRALAEILGCTVWISHHAAKQTKDTSKRRIGQGMRGSSAIHGSVDNGMYIEPREGDGTNVFSARVSSQVKSARSVPPFDLRLTIEDDANGEAIRATWLYSRAESKADAPTRSEAKADAEAAMDAEMLKCIAAKVAAGIFLTPTEYRDLTKADGRPIPTKKIVASINRLREAKAIEMRLGRVHLPEL